MIVVGKLFFNFFFKKKLWKTFYTKRDKWYKEQVVGQGKVSKKGKEAQARKQSKARKSKARKLRSY